MKAALLWQWPVFNKDFNYPFNVIRLAK